MTHGFLRNYHVEVESQNLIFDIVLDLTGSPAGRPAWTAITLAPLRIIKCKSVKTRKVYKVDTIKHSVYQLRYTVKTN